MQDAIPNGFSNKMQNQTLHQQIELQAEAIAIEIIELNNVVDGQITDVTICNWRQAKQLLEQSSIIQSQSILELCVALKEGIAKGSQLVSSIQEIYLDRDSVIRLKNQVKIAQNLLEKIKE